MGESDGSPNLPDLLRPTAVCPEVAYDPAEGREGRFTRLLSTETGLIVLVIVCGLCSQPYAADGAQTIVRM